MSTILDISNQIKTIKDFFSSFKSSIDIDKYEIKTYIRYKTIDGKLEEQRIIIMWSRIYNNYYVFINGSYSYHDVLTAASIASIASETIKLEKIIINCVS